MHKNPYKHRFIAGSSKCSTKPLSIILTKLLTHIKQGLQKYCETAYSRSGVNQMWILKNSKELLDHLKSPIFNLITNIKSFDFSTLYTTIPHQKLKSRLATIIRNSFLHKNGNRRYKYLVLGREGPYFVKEHSAAKNKYTEEDMIKMLEFLVDNIFVVFAGKVFQQIVGIPMGTNCAPLLADIFLYSYEAEFIQSLLSTGKKRLASQFNFTYRYIDDVLSINNPDFENYLGKMYPPELEIKDTTESNTSASYLDLLLSIGRDGQLRTSLYDKRDDFNFHITNFPFLSSNIPSSPAYGVFISQLIRYARACFSYECFILRAMRLSNKLLGQGYVKERLKSSLRKFYGRYGDLTKQYEVPLSRMLHDILDDDHIQWHPPLIGHYTIFWPLLIWTLLPNLTFYLIVQGFHRTYATGAACQQRTLTPPDTWSCPTLGLACVLMSRPISPELVLSPDFWISNTPRYFSFAFLSWTGGEWVRIPLETYIFILNFSHPPRSEHVNEAVANEIKHVHSPEVIVVLDPRYDFSYKALYISTCSIALSTYLTYLFHCKSFLWYFQYIFAHCFTSKLRKIRRKDKEKLNNFIRRKMYSTGFELTTPDSKCRCSYHCAMDDLQFNDVIFPTYTPVRARGVKSRMCTSVSPAWS